MDTVMDQELPRPTTYEQTTHVVKGKRTKRTRPQSPFMAASSSSASMSGDDPNYDNTADVALSPAASAQSSDGGATEEEQDLANCLILLAQGSSKEPPPVGDTGEDDDTKLLLGQRLAEPATTTTTATATGKYVYECKTCNRSFPSFQALGGHRASHKKAKLVAVGSGVGEEERQVGCLALQVYKHSSDSPSPYYGSNAAKSRVHECSICGAEFSSGQALGGHKRRHRAAMAAAGESVVPPESKKQRSSALSLDLNLPAPEEDYPSSPRSFTFAGKQTLVFAATPLAAMRPMVDCHY